jgi:flavin reductase (DIM6/NTAB) family NADH-FMN oxidoreductase RutF
LVIDPAEFERAMSFDPSTFRTALGCFATGITVVTAVAPDGQLLGLTANSFNSVSLDPPLVLFSLDRQAYSFEIFLAVEHFAVSVLGHDQRHLSHAFARPGGPKWDGVRHGPGAAGCPLLAGALATFECRTRHTYPGGDHVIFVGEVTDVRGDPSGEPLVFYRGVYRGLDGTS